MTRKIIVNRVYLDRPDERVRANFPPLRNLRFDLLESKDKVDKNIIVEDTVSAINNRSEEKPQPIEIKSSAYADIPMIEKEPSDPPLFNKQFNIPTPMKVASSTPTPLKEPDPEPLPLPPPQKEEEPEIPFNKFSENEVTEEQPHISDIYEDEQEPPEPVAVADWLNTPPPDGLNSFTEKPFTEKLDEPTFAFKTPTPKATPSVAPPAERIIEPALEPVKPAPKPSPPPPSKKIEPQKSPEQIEKEQVIKWRWAHHLLKEKWPTATFPEITDYMDSNTLKDKYFEIIRKLVLKNNIDSYRDYLLFASAAIEYGGIMIFGINTLSGLTRFHFKSMTKYHHLLVEMGESNDQMFAASLPAWVRLLIYVLFQTVIFWLLQYAQSKGGDSKLQNMLSFFIGDSDKQAQPKVPEADMKKTEQELNQRDKVKKAGKIPPPLTAQQIKNLRK